jgi:hypothetical protein
MGRVDVQQCLRGQLLTIELVPFSLGRSLRLLDALEPAPRTWKSPASLTLWALPT